MTILRHMIDLIATVLPSSLLNAIFWPVLALCFLATVPCLIRKFWR